MPTVRNNPSHYLSESPTSPGIGEILAPPNETLQPVANRLSRPQSIGHTRWAIAEGYIPSKSTGEPPAMTSHETVCLLNTGEKDADVTLTIFFSDHDPFGPYHIRVPARRTRHVRFNDLNDPQPIPRDTDYATLIESTMPVVAQHTRLDSRQAANTLLSTIAFGDGP